MKLVLGITAPMSVLLIEGQVHYYSSRGYEVYLLAPEADETIAYCRREGCHLLPVEIRRDISPLRDLKTVFQVCRHLLAVRPDIVNVGTPKMGLLGTLAAFLTRTPKRVYTCRGFRYEHERGPKRHLLVAMERLAASLADHVVCISPSVRELGIRDGIFPPTKAVVIGAGSSNGVDVGRFSRTSVDMVRREELMVQHGLEQCFVYGFVGRLIERKGVRELCDAFERLYEQDAAVRLLVVGDPEHEQLPDGGVLEWMRDHPGVVWVGFQGDVPLYMSLMDALVLPAWAEGFGNVLIQAAAMELPVVSTRVTGCRDAVADGFNGILVEKGDVAGLATALQRLREDPALRRQLGGNGREWASRFKPEIVWEGLRQTYES